MSLYPQLEDEENYGKLLLSSATRFAKKWGLARGPHSTTPGNGLLLVVLASAAVTARGAPAPCFVRLRLRHLNHSFQRPVELCGTGFRCEQGKYCTNVAKYPCLTFGSSTDETSFSCLDGCPAGQFCPEGSSSPIACGNSSMFCTADLASPAEVSPEKHSTGGVSASFGQAEEICKRGHYCLDGVMALCPAGTFGETEGLKEVSCSGSCPAGWYCPAGTVDPFALSCGGPEYFCPGGSRRPLPVDRGHYANGVGIDRKGEPGGYTFQTRCPIGRWCDQGLSFPCPPGRFGASQASTNSSCTGLCQKGHYCPEGSYRADQHVCGNASVYCPEGVSSPTKVSKGFYTVGGAIGEEDRHPWLGVVSARVFQVLCEPGFYCMEGIRRPCPPGTYGDTSGLSKPSCSGPCAAGYVCNKGSTTANEAVCGGEGERFCPEGSSSPSTVHDGYYTYAVAHAPQSAVATTAEQRQGQLYSNRTSNVSMLAINTAEELCEPGYWCYAGIRYPCAAGYFGDVFGETRGANCSGACSPGFLCGKGSVSSKAKPCGRRFDPSYKQDPSVYCPGGSWEPEPVLEGYFSIGGGSGEGNTRTGQQLALPGRYASQGIVLACPAGYYGASYGLSSSRCSGQCAPGFYCPSGSVSPRERACGGASLICPAGSGFPIKIEDGYYTTDYSTVPDQEHCPPGTFRNTSSPYSIDPTRGDPSAIYTAIPLAPCQPCPEGTFKANSGDSLDMCLLCNAQTAESIDTRTSCTCRRISGGDLTADILYFNITSAECQNVTANFRPPEESVLVETVYTRYAAAECESGHYCVNGVRFPCPAGRYSASTRGNRSECEGECEPGWYCPEASVSATQVPCGAANLYCPRGSAAPVFVDRGFYTVGGYQFDSGQRSTLEKGFFYDAVVVHDDFNPLTTTTTNSNDINNNGNKEVSGKTMVMPDLPRGASFRSDVVVCPEGWYCTGDGSGSKCPPGTYGSKTGMADPECSGKCTAGHFCPVGSISPFERKCGGVSVYCPEGSWQPSKVLQGYYGVHAGPRADSKASMDPLNMTHSAQVLCEPGYFCEGGLKEPCPKGTFIWEFGESSRESCTPCKAGYYCPGAPDGPSLTALPTDCGSPEVYCPRGSATPILVASGYYSVGGGADGSTRISQVRCEPGNYCQAGIKVVCPQGMFGNTAGLNNPRCNGLCPPGQACAEGTVNPTPCEKGFYAVGGAVACNACPGRLVTGGGDGIGDGRCRTSRSCCT